MTRQVPERPRGPERRSLDAQGERPETLDPAGAGIREIEGGCTIAVQVVPGARSTAIVGTGAGAVRVRVAAKAIDGRANEALLVELASVLGVRRRALTLRSGARHRSKVVAVDGMVAATAHLAIIGAASPSSEA